jgi:hypothetical protein
VPAPLFLGGIAPDPGVSVVQRPSQTGPGDRARSAYLLGLLDLRQGGTRDARRKEQVGIHVETGGIVSPVHTCGVSPPLEKAFARDTQDPPPFLLWASTGSSDCPRISRGWAAAITANAHIRARLAVLADPLLAVTCIGAGRWAEDPGDTWTRRENTPT